MFLSSSSGCWAATKIQTRYLWKPCTAQSVSHQAGVCAAVYMPTNFLLLTLVVCISTLSKISPHGYLIPREYFLFSDVLLEAEARVVRISWHCLDLVWCFRKSDHLRVFVAVAERHPVLCSEILLGCWYWRWPGLEKQGTAIEELYCRFVPRSRLDALFCFFVFLFCQMNRFVLAAKVSTVDLYYKGCSLS